LNKNLLKTDVQEFIYQNLTSDISSLILKGSPFEDVSVQELANQISCKRKAKEKLPNWFHSENILYPKKVSIEQTSSEITAQHKSQIVKGNSIIDITGGFGIDAYYFSKHFKKVVHCELDENLSEIVNHNYKILKTENITTIKGNGINYLENNPEKFDVIYIDPSRRNETKGKVFLLSDCLPNVPENIDFLFSKTNTILIKNSPILDISATINELKFVKEIQIIAVKNEVKELLFLLEKDYSESIQIKTYNFHKDKTHFFEFSKGTEAISSYDLPQSFLYEPNVAILKSGGFHNVSSFFNLKKIHQHSHLYTSNKLIKFPGRSFKIIDVLPYDKKKLNKILSEKKANITVRNFPKSVAQIRKETKIKDGGDFYLFFTKFSNNKNGIIICKKASL